MRPKMEVKRIPIPFGTAKAWVDWKIKVHNSWNLDHTLAYSSSCFRLGLITLFIMGEMGEESNFM